MVMLAVPLLAGAAPATAAKQYNVALVVDSGVGPGDRNAPGALYRSFLSAVHRFGVRGRVVQADPQKDPTGLLTSLARQRYDLIITGLVYDVIVGSVAQAFPESRFLMPDYSYSSLKHRPKNVEGATFRSEQAGYLAGYLGAHMAKLAGKHMVSSIGGVSAPPIDAFIAGYQAGVRKVDPRIRMLNDYAGDFGDPAKCRAVALGQISRGSGVVFPVAGACGLGALQAAKEKGVYGIGVDLDQSYLGSHVLTSALKNWNPELFGEIRALTQDRLKTGGDLIFDLRNGGVGLGKISPKVPRTLVRRVEAIRRQIVAGKIKVPSTIR